MSKKEKLLISVCSVIGILTVGIWNAVWDESTSPRSTTLEVSFLNVGQGDSIFIEAPNGNQLLIDGGKGNEVLQELGKKMHWYDRTIDVVIATHPDFDHIGGLDEVFNRFNVAHIIRSGVETDKETADIFIDAALQETGTTTVAQRGMKIMLDEEKNIYFEVLSPDRDVRHWETNDASIVGKLVYGSTCFIFTGDAPIHVEDYLIALDTKNSENDLDCQILKAGHHGSRTSTGERFIQAVTPDYVIISAGENNSYGHPHKEVLSLLEKYTIPVLTTYNEESITFISDGSTVIRK